MPSKVKKSSNPWLVHVKSVQKANPGLSYSDVLKKAKKSYRSKQKQKLRAREAKGKGAIKDIIKKEPLIVTKFLELHGDKKVVSIQVCRTPITRSIKKFVNFLQGGNLSEVEKKYSYDDIYHLFMIVELDDGEKYRMEKNTRVRIAKASPQSTQKEGTAFVANYRDNLHDKSICKPPTKTKMTLNELIRKGEARGQPGFWRYSAHKNNCQKFIKDILNANGIYKYNSFIYQNAKDLLPKGGIRNVLQLTADALALAERIYSGGSAG